NGISSKLINRLWRKAKVPHNRNSGTQNTFNAVFNLNSALHFYSMGSRLFHNPDGGTKGFGGIPLVTSERQVYHHQCPVNAPHHTLGMIDHLINSDGKRGFVAGHHIRGRITHQDDLDACSIYQLSHREVIGSKAGYFLAL